MHFCLVSHRYTLLTWFTMLQRTEIIRHILRSDVTEVRNILANINQEPNGIRRGNLVQELVDQMADGGRNILHLCAAMCTPTTNKEAEEVTTSSLGAALDAYSAASRRDDLGCVPSVLCGLYRSINSINCY